MKKLILVTLLGVFSASQLMAVDLFITGSTAFRKQVYTACTKLFTSAPTIVYDTSEAYGGDGTTANSNPVWTMSGNAAAGITALSGAALVIHGNFTGSVQGCQVVENTNGIIFLTAAGLPNVVTNSATIAFSDVSSSSTPYPASGNFAEEKVAVQPFAIFKSASVSASMNAITNVTGEQLKAIINLGNLPLSEWSGNYASDYNTPIYIIHRTQDSGTRRSLFAVEGYPFAQTITTYNYDVTNHLFYQPSGNAILALGSTNCAVVGAFGGYNNANLNWGPGYIGGGDIKAALKVNDTQNLSIGYLSLSDGEGITSSDWANMISLNGIWPTATGPGIHGNTGTNDFTPITKGYYPYWAYEVVVYPKVDPSSISHDQNLTHAQLGNQTTAGTILGVLDKVNTVTPVLGSLDNEILASEAAGQQNTAIRLIEMVSSRSAVGGPISP